MASSGTVCPGCGAPASAGQRFCPNCGRAIDAAPSVPSGPILSRDAWDPVYVQDELAARADLPRAASRVSTGLLLMIVAFGLLWVPYVQYLGSLIGLIGIIYLFLGRKAFDEPFRNGVVRGCALIVVGVLVEIFAALLYVFAAVAAATSPGVTPASVASSLQQDLVVLFGGALLGTVLLSLGYVSLPYGKAGPPQRSYLWAAFALAVSIAAAQFTVLWLQLSKAISSSTSGTTINLAPIQALQTESLELGLLQVLPYLLFLLAYYRVRSQMSAAPVPSLPTPPA